MKEQNTLHLAGWLLDYTERMESINGTPGYILEVTLRSDREFFGGHHRMWMLNWTGLKTRTYLDIFTDHARRYPLADIERLSGEALSRHFLKVVVSGWLCGNMAVADEVTYLNITEEMRCEAKRQLAALESNIDNEAWPHSSEVARVLFPQARAS